MKTTRHLILAASLLILSALLAAPARAADGVVGSGSPASCTESAFSSVLGSVQNSGGGTITFNCGAAPHTLVFGAYKSIEAPVVIDGGGRITLDGAGSAPFFQVFFNGSLTLKNLSLVNGGYSGIHPLENFGSLSLEGVSLRQHSVSGSPIVNYGTLAIRSSSFGGNFLTGASASGGVLHNSGGEANIEASIFSGNHADNHGGAIFNEGGILTIAGSTFTGNSAARGGAIYIDSASVASIHDTTFKDNTANGGGAIFSTNAPLTITRAHFASNQATLFRGGAAWIASGTVELTRTQFSANYAFGDGGGLACSGAFATIDRSTFAANRARLNGGGVFSQCGLSIANSTFSANRAETLGGGALYQSGSQSALVSYATIAYNSAVFGAGVYNDGGGSSTLAVSRSIVAHNSAGNCDGVIVSNGYNLTNDSGCGAFTETGDQINAVLPLSPLSYAGSETQTHYIRPGSAAHNHIPLAACLTNYDQRGTARPQQGACDSGAVEFMNRAVYLPLTRK